MTVRYELAARAWDFPEIIERIVERSRAERICEVGAGANPLLSSAFVDRKGLSYTLLDSSPEELAKAGAGYDRIVTDISSPGFVSAERGRFDVVFSRTVAEHVVDARAFHSNVRSMLAPGGVACHFFPTLFALPFVLNKLLPEPIVTRLLLTLQPKRVAHGHHGKFRAHYRWCVGPHNSQLRRLEDLGYDVVEYVGYFGHHYYARVPPIQHLVDWSASLVLAHPNPWLTSYACVTLRRHD